MRPQGPPHQADHVAARPPGGRGLSSAALGPRGGPWGSQQGAAPVPPPTSPSLHRSPCTCCLRPQVRQSEVHQSPWTRLHGQPPALHQVPRTDPTRWQCGPRSGRVRGSPPCTARPRSEAPAKPLSPPGGSLLPTSSECLSSRCWRPARREALRPQCTAPRSEQLEPQAPQSRSRTLPRRRPFSPASASSSCGVREGPAGRAESCLTHATRRPRRLQTGDEKASLPAR